jgi:hypothetical protein
MKQYLLVATLVVLLVAVGAHASNPPFMFGVWNNAPKDATMGQHLAMLHDTLHFNTVLDDCVNDFQLEQYSNPQHPLKVIVSNQSYSSAGMNAYLRLYTLAPYAFFESEGTEFADTHLRYIGGSDTTIGQDTCRYFQALSTPSDSLRLIQTGPGLEGYDSYNQLGWYWPQFVDTTREPAHLQYKAYLRFKLGPRTGPVSSEPVGVFYMGRWGGPDEADGTVNDTLITQTPVYLYDSQFDSAGTDFIWSDSLVYQWNNSFVDSLMTVKDVMFNVRWSGKRDIYIDKVKIMDKYGYELWEDTVASSRNMNSFVTRFYDTSSTVLGWYLQDDQDVRTNCNNVFSARRVDSLLTNRFSHKPGFLVPGGWVWDYISMASYSNVSFFSYVIDTSIRTDSEEPYPTSVQQAWDNHTGILSSMADVARSKGVKPYATLQAFAVEGARRPTPQENLCQVNLALAYGMKGILYWRYGAYNGWEDSTGRTPFWYSVKDIVGPYIDKMGPIFASLEWKGAWKWGFEDKPTGTPIREILCNEYPSDPIYCPDCLYMQVAEFEPASLSDDTAYFFLTNRRCLPEESITGTVSFNDFGGIGRELKVFHVTDMLTGASWLCDDNRSFYSFNYAVPPGAGRLYRVTPRCRHHGDANGDGSIDVSDAVFLISYIFSGGPAPDPLAAGDANCDGEVDISDAVFLISYIFSGGLAPCPGCN